MTTTDPHHTPTGEPSAPPSAEPDELRARRDRRIQQLLARRDRLAVIVSERQAHDLPDREGYLLDLLETEQSIGHCAPDLWSELAFTDWLYADMARMHTADTPLVTCSICAYVSGLTGPAAGETEGPFRGEAA